MPHVGAVAGWQAARRRVFERLGVTSYALEWALLAVTFPHGAGSRYPTDVA